MFFKSSDRTDPLHWREKELLLQVSRGNEQAFAALFRQYRQRVYSYAMHFTRSSASAEEIVQEVFLKLWLHREKLAQLENFEGYLRVMARNFSFNVLKKLAAEDVLKNGWALTKDEAENTVQDRLIEKDHVALLKHAVEQLPAQQRLVYTLRSDLRLKNGEIAARLNITPATVKVHLKKGLRTMRAFINARKDIAWLIFLTMPHFF